MSQVFSSWDGEYRRGRYRNEPPVQFIDDILSACHQVGITSGLYIGCGNGRNYTPLVERGLDLTGVDMSPVAIEQLSERMPDRRHRLIVGGLSVLPPGQTFGAVIETHFFSNPELEGLFAADFEPLLPLRCQTTARPLPDSGSWPQWEGIWRREGRRHIAYHNIVLAQYASRYDRKARRLRAVDSPELFSTAYRSPQLEFWELDDEQWRKIAPRPYERHPVPIDRGLRHLTLLASSPWGSV